jgi:hypothetical protein
MLRLGAVRIFLIESTTTPLLTITPAASAEATTSASPQPFQATPRPSATPISSALGLAKEATTALNETQIQVNLSAHLPTKPIEAKPPDKAFWFNANLRSKRPD